MNSNIVTHEDDLIFQYKSLQEFIRLIKLQGINGLEIYSVNDLIRNNYWKDNKFRIGDPNLKICEFYPENGIIEENNPDQKNEELESHKGCIVFINKSKEFEEGYKDTYVLLNEEMFKDMCIPKFSFIGYKVKKELPFKLNTTITSTRLDPLNRIEIREDERYVYLGECNAVVNPISQNTTYGERVFYNNDLIKLNEYPQFSLYLPKINIVKYKKFKSNSEQVGYMIPQDYTWLQQEHLISDEVSDPAYAEYIFTEIREELNSSNQGEGTSISTIALDDYYRNFNPNEIEQPSARIRIEKPSIQNGEQSIVYYKVQRKSVAEEDEIDENQTESHPADTLEYQYNNDLNLSRYDTNPDPSDINLNEIMSILITEQYSETDIDGVTVNNNNPIIYTYNQTNDTYIQIPNGYYTTEQLRETNYYIKENPPKLINVLNGRHLYVKSLGDIDFYAANGIGEEGKGPITKYNITDYPNNLDPRDKEVDGTFTIKLDDDHSVIRIRGFDDQGNWTGGIKPKGQAGNTDTFLRPDGWTNYVTGDLFAGEAPENKSNTATMAAIEGEKNIGVIGKVGSIYLYSQDGSDENHNNIGIYGYNASGTAQDILYVNQDGNVVIPNLKITDSEGATGTDAQFLRGDKTWTHILKGHFFINSDTATENFLAIQNEKKELSGAGICRLRVAYDDTRGNYFWVSKNNLDFSANNGVSFWAKKVYNAVYNDYAECRKTIDLEPGRAVADNDDGTLYCTNKRLIPGAQIISDTYGHCMGESENYKTPIAVAGRVLVYTYQPRENYHAGMAVCSAPNGTVDIMTREEIRDYPDCIIGIVSEIPQYETWGTDNVEINGRIWIKVK